MILTRKLLENDFADGSQDLEILSGNGSFGESGGALNFTIPAGQNGDWWTSGRNSIAARDKFGLIPGRYLELRAEATFTAFSGNTYNELYFNLYKGDVDWYQLFLTSGGVNLMARRMVGAAVTDYASVALPAFPFRVRMVWDVVGKTGLADNLW